MTIQPDWSKAPEGATHEHNGDFFIRDGDRWYVYLPSSSKWSEESVFLLEALTEKFTARPQQWNGEGLPPVGTVCLARNEDINGGRPVKAEILKHHENGEAAAFFWVNAPDFERNLLWAGRFMPLPEQIAAEERTKTIDDMVKALGMENAGTAEYIRCGLIYDAGYRDSTEVLAALEALAKAYRQAVGLDGAYDKALLKAESLLGK